MDSFSIQRYNIRKWIGFFADTVSGTVLTGFVNTEPFFQLFFDHLPQATNCYPRVCTSPFQLLAHQQPAPIFFQAIAAALLIHAVSCDSKYTLLLQG